jgi:hypothetical protein
VAGPLIALLIHESLHMAVSKTIKNKHTWPVQ